MSEPEKLWTRNALYFIIEIKVGNAWVEHGRKNTEDEAIAEAQKVLTEPAVSAARVCENEVVHVCTKIWEEEDKPVIRLPPKMTPVGREQTCPRCKRSAPVASDGTTEWVFCGDCNRAMPA